MSPHGRVGTALLLVAVCMVRAYPKSPNQTTAGSGESGWNEQHYASSARTSRSNLNSGPTVGYLRAPGQNLVRNQQRQLPGQEFPEPPMQVPRRVSNDDRPPLQQPRGPAHHPEHSQFSRQGLPQHTSNRPHGTQQNTHRAQHRSIQTWSENVPHSNEDQYEVEKPRAIAVDTNHERTAPGSRAYPSPPERAGHSVHARRFEKLQMAPQPSLHSHTTASTTVSTLRSNVTSVRKGPSRTPTRPSSESEEKISFPDQILIAPKIGEDGPECAKNGLTFCEDIEGYPKDQISKLIQKDVGLYKSVFGTDVAAPDIANRMPAEEELCKYDEYTAYPQVGKNKDDQWTWIANTEDFKQGVRVEKCQTIGSECQLVTNWPLGYVTECKQKHIYRRLLSVANDGKPNTDEFLFPSCCTCTFKKTENK